MGKIFNTDKRIKLGIWGLGRGQSFIKAASALNIDVVAGCDINPMMRESFKKNVPDAYVTDNEDDFLKQDIDAVLIATFFMDHSKHAIKAMEAGKHVMCEVTSFLTPGDGVKLVEAVEKYGKVYNLLENYSFTKENMFLRKLYEDGFFGDFMYAEFEYLHECRTLAYAYNVGNGVPIEPGYAVHSWRSFLNMHYYNTHSLGPVMAITGLRPVSVYAPVDDITLPGYLDELRTASVCPSFVKMSNGGLVRNLMGSTTNDYHMGGRFWGTRAGADKLHGLKIRVGACGGGEVLNIKPEWPEMGELADTMGHGGGDFWELYYFAREVLEGKPAPWNIYAAADVTLAGIMAARSYAMNGATLDIPDFRKKEDRERFKDDFRHEMRKNFDPMGLFPAGHDTSITGNYSKVMVGLYPKNANGGLPCVNKALDGMKLYPFIADADGKLAIVKNVIKAIDEMPELAKLCQMARRIAEAYPDCMPGRSLKRLLVQPEIAKVEDTANTIAEFKTWLDGIKA